MFESLKKVQEYENNEIKEPVSKKDVEDAIKLINIAHEVGCDFDLQLTLEIGEFCVSADSYTGIKMLNKTKTDGDRLVISYKNALLSNDTIIDLKNILHISLKIEFCDKNERIE